MSEAAYGIGGTAEYRLNVCQLLGMFVPMVVLVGVIISSGSRCFTRSIRFQLLNGDNHLVLRCAGNLALQPRRRIGTETWVDDSLGAGFEVVKFFDHDKLNDNASMGSFHRPVVFVVCRELKGAVAADVASGVDSVLNGLQLYATCANWRAVRKDDPTLHWIRR